MWVLTSFWADQNHWREMLNTHSGCQFLLQCLRVSESLTRMAECASREWVALQCLSIWKSLWWITEHTSSVWVAALHCFDKSDPTDKMTEHASSKWVSLQCCSNLNHSSWQKWLISSSECNLLSPYFHCFTILIIFLEAYDISAFLTAYFESDDSGLSLSQSVSCFYCDWILFTGMLYAFSFILSLS